MVSHQGPHDKDGKLGLSGFERGLAQWSEDQRHSVDRFFPVRFWLVGAVVLFYAFVCLFTASEVAMRLHPNTATAQNAAGAIYARGWTLVIFLAGYAISYTKNKYIGLVTFLILTFGAVNYFYDLFAIFQENLKDPTPSLVILYILRSLCLWMLYYNIRNLSRIPPIGCRFDIFLPFRKV